MFFLTYFFSKKSKKKLDIFNFLCYSIYIIRKGLKMEKNTSKNKIEKTEEEIYNDILNAEEDAYDEYVEQLNDLMKALGDIEEGK